MDKDLLLKDYLASIDIVDFQSRKLFVIGMVGLPGAGKSTFARTLAEQLGMYIASNDRIRRFMNERGFEGDALIQDTLQFIAEASSRYLYKQRASHIIDADLVKFHSVARENAKRYGAEFFLVHVTANESDVRSRLVRRAAKIEGGDTGRDLSRVDIKEYERRKKIHQELEMPPVDFTVDSSKDLSPQIDTIRQALVAQGCI